MKPLWQIEEDLDWFDNTNTKGNKMKSPALAILAALSLGLIGDKHQHNPQGRSSPPGQRVKFHGDKRAAKRLRKLSEQSKKRNRKAA